MRRDGPDSLAEATRRRLELMARELDGGTAAADVGAEDGAPPPDAPAVRPAGRHLRRQVGVEDRVTGWVEDRMPLPVRGRLHLGMRELLLVVLVAGVGLALTATAVLRSGAHEVSAPVPTPTGALLSAAATPGGSPSGLPVPASAPSPSPSDTVVVDVTGRVRRPGVVTLPAGSRVIDALRRAGGARRRADLTSLNLAAVLTDGQQVLVGVPASASGAAGATASAGSAATGSLVDLNGASQDQLESLPGVGPVTAEKILAWRTAHGAFSSLDELLEVDGIGPKTLAELAPHLTL